MQNAETEPNGEAAPTQNATKSVIEVKRIETPPCCIVSLMRSERGSEEEVSS